MAENTIRSRIQLKNDTEVNWNKALNFYPRIGEVIIYNEDNDHPYTRLKVGNGSQIVKDLPFVGGIATSVESIKYNSTAAWNENLTYVPNAGDIIIYSDKTTLSDGTLVPGIKIGDGNAYCVDLPFIGDEFLEALSTHASNTTIHTTSAEKTFWNNKLNCVIVDENLQLNRN